MKRLKIYRLTFELIFHDIYNRTLGRYILNWDEECISLFGFCFIEKTMLAFLYSKEAYDFLREGLNDKEWEIIKSCHDNTNAWPKPALANGNYSKIQMDDHKIYSLFNRYYVHRHCLYPFPRELLESIVELSE